MYDNERMIKININLPGIYTANNLIILNGSIIHHIVILILTPGAIVIYIHFNSLTNIAISIEPNHLFWIKALSYNS